MSVEETLVLIKPDGVARNLTGEILRRIEAKGYQLVDLKMVEADLDLLAAHYEEHQGKPFDRGISRPGRNDRPDRCRPRHDPRRPRPRLGTQGPAESRAR
jgi:Nucleoside diphosphate kinase